MISLRDQAESQYMSGNSSRPTVFLAKRASTSDADGPEAFPYQVSASESYWSSQETSATTFLTLLSDREITLRCTQDHQFSKKCNRLGVLYVVQVTVTFDWVPCMCMIR